MAESPRTILLTGATSGIGRALSHAFVANGDNVIGLGRRTQLLVEMKSRTARLSEGPLSGRQTGGSFVGIAVDVRNAAALRNVVKKVLRRSRFIDILVNNAGVTVFKEFARTSLKEFDDVIDTNLRAYFVLAQSVLPSMLRRRRGLIINVLSFAAKTTYANSAVYAASKAGARAMMNGLRIEARSKGIHVMNVFPGAVKTPMWPSGIRKTAGGKMLSAEHVASAIVNLTNQDRSLMVEEVVLRPQVGDIII